MLTFKVQLVVTGNWLVSSDSLSDFDVNGSKTFEITDDNIVTIGNEESCPWIHRNLNDLTADRLAQLVEHRTAVREVAGSNLDRTNTQGL